jgi:hypothetical protein
MKRRLLAALIVILCAVPSMLRAQCAMCGSAAASSPGVARGLAYSIFFLLGMLALVVAWLVVLVRRCQSRAHPETAVSVPPPIPGSRVPTGHAPAEP